MPTLLFFDKFIEDLAEKRHDLGSDTIKAYLSADTPVVATDNVIADVADLSTNGGYVSGGQDTLNTNSQTGGVNTVSCTATLTWTAVGGAIDNFDFVIIHNSTANLLIGWYVIGSTISLATGESFIVTFTGSELFTLS